MLIKLSNLFGRSNELTELNDISKVPSDSRKRKSDTLQFYSANRNIGNYLPVLAIHEMLDETLDTWNIHKSPVDWGYVHANYSRVIIGGAGLLHSVFEKFWVDLEKNCKLPITIWGIGVCLPDNDEVKGVPKEVVKRVFAKSKFANVRDELTRDFYELDSEISITACPTLVYVSNHFDVAEKRIGNRVLHSSHVDLEPNDQTPIIRDSIERAGFEYAFTPNIESAENGLNRILKLYQDTNYVVTTRLHGAIIAYAFRRPYIAISYDPKITAFHKLYGGGVCIKNPNELARALISEDFKEESNYQIELDRVREFGLIVKSAFKVER
ncbi:MAG: hypothetical protein F2846_02375 [Actinobacteria bacterium]|uniref:Unannotated protein n=2 Tax=freshwater metagenome TaxID=449393 RepID=A0A6J7QKE0_9ZZZZ|nr:hypothetical protein [Actinomycetota bacterium]MSV78915.1 hypothetical protein [Actinomycetota bacterium]MSW16118.1 hypothetical protein [Actinomycetota bacterium]MSZ00192.1 hypothetical protein [Actinomycetota bacterium]